ncbi:hypothetical protein MLD38_038317 [Melastoma candidum]|uniref:Uncharacterized protein n=1 Tax=Melastoma candidum TaxID=119954 RepID=A0ACB9L0U8_9MYRT|nr:hypothetical protein MLD38_038317 [Melastoma candidum]
MMLRSSSTPVLGSLLASSSSSSLYHNVSDGPLELHHHGKLPSHHPATPISCSSSPVIDTFRGKGNGGGFRRVHSEGNLEVVATEGNRCLPHAATRPRGSLKILDSIPSFSLRGEGSEDEDEEDKGSVIDDLDCGKAAVRNNVSHTAYLRTVVLEKKREGVRPEVMYLAKGLGIHETSVHGSCDNEGGFGEGNGRCGGSSSGGGRSGRGGGGDGYGLDLEGYYKKIVEEDPGNPLFLQNYAQFLYKVKGDLEKAEEYYSRAVLTDPGNGEILSQYAKLVWELRHDHDMASSYFESAARASPEDSHVQAAYAGFLWDAEDTNDEDKPNLKVHKVQPRFASFGHSVEPAPSN